MRAWPGAGCGASAPPPKKPVKPVRVDITMWVDGTERTDIHVHEDQEGDGPIIRFADLTGAQRSAIARKLARWTHEVDVRCNP